MSKGSRETAFWKTSEPPGPLSAQWFEACANVLGKELRLFPGGKVAADVDVSREGYLYDRVS
jgi:hypothetical protein